MKYVLDDSAIYYMLESFPKKAVPTLFDSFCMKCNEGDVVSDKETKKSLENMLEEELSFQWIDEHGKMFRSINQKEARIMGELVDEGAFDYITKSNAFIRNLPIALPFMVAIAINEKRTIVVDKKAKDSSIIFELCKREKIRFASIDDFLSEILK